MSVKDREAVLAFLAQNAVTQPLGMAEQRARLDGLAVFFPLHDGTEVEAAQINGVKGEWVRARRAHSDAALLYLHGAHKLRVLQSETSNEYSKGRDGHQSRTGGAL